MRAKVVKEHLPRRNFHERHGDNIRQSDDEYNLLNISLRLYKFCAPFPESGENNRLSSFCTRTINEVER